MLREDDGERHVEGWGCCGGVGGKEGEESDAGRTAGKEIR